MGPCCVEGCNGIGEDTVYFEFPTSRGLRRKWLEMIKLPAKVPLGTVVCSQHFSSDDYEVVRGKVRLKRKVVPTLRLYNNLSRPPPKETESTTEKPDPSPKDTSDNPKSPEKSDVPEKSELPQPDSTTDPDSEAPKRSSRRGSAEENEEDIICKVVNKEIEKTSEREESLPELSDPKQPPDFEEMITNYQIKNSKPNALIPDIGGEIEIEVPPPPGVSPDTIVLDDKGDAPPVFIEISVDKDNNTTNAGSQDCLMVLESVQVEVDPSSLMLPEREYDEVDLQINDDKKDDPISLLTSSDEDDVIIEEPHIDTVEVSDETDEDDVPLVKLLKKKTPKKKKKSKKEPPTTENIQKLVWGGAYDFYCMQCHFSTTDSGEYNTHMQDHHRVLQVCHICNYTTASKTQFARHLRKHKDEKRYKCHLCDYRAKHNMSLIYHMRLHDEDGAEIDRVKRGFKCKDCGATGDSKSAVLKHLKLCGKNKKFACDQCMYVTKRKSDLKRHRLCRHQSKVVNIDSDGSCQEWD